MAYGSVESGYSVSPFGLSDSVSKSSSGWTAGAGVEYKLTHNLSLKTEYLYADLGKQPLIDAAPFATVGSKKSFHTIKAGLNLAF